MSVKNSRLPVAFCKVPGFPAYAAGIVGSNLNGQNGTLRQGFEIAFDEGRQREISGFNTSGLIAKHVRGVGPEGATKINLPGASNLQDLRYYMLFPKTGYVRPLKGQTVVTERNGLSIVKFEPMLHNNPALTELGDCKTIATFAQALPRKVRAAKGGDADTASDDYGLDESLVLELLGIVEKRDAEAQAAPVMAEAQAAPVA